jgi:hypothetical protein
VWKLFSDNSTLQTGGTTYTPSIAEFGDSVYVTLTIQDNEGQIVTGSTADYGPISKPPFPNPTPPTIPSSVGQNSCFTWDGSNTTLRSDGCLLFSVNAQPFSQGPTPVLSGQTVCTQWSNTAPNVCGNAVSGNLIEGCLFNDDYSSCGSVLIDRIPDAFTINPETVPAGSTATSFPVTITGNNAPAYITVAPGSSGIPGTYQASINGGPFQTVPPTGTYSLSILSGQTLTLRFQTGNVPTSTYTFNVQLGDSTGNTTTSFVVTTSSSSFPVTPVTFPTTTSGVGSVGTSVAWGNGTVNITGVGCIEFSLDGITYTQTSTQIQNGDILRTRYIASAGCGNNTTGQTITGEITDTTNTESTSLTIDRVPDSVSFTTQSSAAINTTYTSNTVTPTGYNSIAYVTLAAGATLTGVQASVNGGTFTTVPASGSTSMPISPGETLRIRATSGGSYNTNYSANIQLGVTGNVSTSSWTVEVGPAVPTVTTPNILLPIDGSTGVGTSAGVTYVSSPFSSADGAGTGHQSSDWEVYASAEFPIQTSAITAVNITPAYTGGSTRSLRFNNSLPNTLTHVFTTPGTSRTKWTWSCWVKKCPAGAQGLFVSGDTIQDQINFSLDNGSGKISFTDQIANSVTANLVTTQTFNSYSNWVHIVLAVDTNSVASVNRIRLYVDGTQITAFDTAVYYPKDADTTMNNGTTFVIGANGITRTNFLNSYLTQVDFVDGQTLLPSSFGELSGSVWIPKVYTGTFGLNGFQLPLDSDANPGPTTVGVDDSGNANNFTPANMQTVESTTISFDTAPVPSTVRMLLVGSGAPGGGTGFAGDGQFGVAVAGGGGGGGAVCQVASYPVTTGRKYALTVGSTPASQLLGNPTTFAGCTALGGGIATGRGGDTYPNRDGSCPTQVGTCGITGLGFPGGTSVNGLYRDPGTPGPGAAGGGGGVGSAGANACTTCITGGCGVSSDITGSSVFYGGGGGGASWNCTPNPTFCSLGGCGGGGYGGGGACRGWGGAGTPNTGGGGGGSANKDSDLTCPGGVGGTGVVILRYPSLCGAPRVGCAINMSTSTVGGDTVYTFTSGTALPLTTSVADSPNYSGTNTGLGNQVSGNYNTWDPTRSTGGTALFNGMLSVGVTENRWAAGTVPMVTGKYYWEVTAFSPTCRWCVEVGVTTATTGCPSCTDSYMYKICNGCIRTPSGTCSAYGVSSLPNDVIGVALDLNQGRMYFAVNGVWQNSGNPVTSVNPAFANLPAGPYYTTVTGLCFSGFPTFLPASCLNFNFGQYPWTHQAPTGYEPILANNTALALTFNNNTNLSNMTVGDSVEEVGGDGTGTISSINVSGCSVTLSYPGGTWTVGEKLEDLDVVLPPGPPTSDPPDPAIYSQIVDITGSTTSLTSLVVGKPPLDPSTVYYARVKYTSNAPVTVSDWSPYNEIKTGTLT